MLPYQHQGEHPRPDARTRGRYLWSSYPTPIRADDEANRRIHPLGCKARVQPVRLVLFQVNPDIRVHHRHSRTHRRYRDLRVRVRYKLHRPLHQCRLILRLHRPLVADRATNQHQVTLRPVPIGQERSVPLIPSLCGGCVDNRRLPAQNQSVFGLGLVTHRAGFNGDGITGTHLLPPDTRERARLVRHDPPSNVFHVFRSVRR